MYVNRKKRSVKWIHDNGGIEEQQFYEGKGHDDIKKKNNEFEKKVLNKIIFAWKNIKALESA